MSRNGHSKKHTPSYAPPSFESLRPFLGRHPSILVLRHAERYSIPASHPTAAITCPLTVTGKAQAKGFGKLLAKEMPYLHPELIVCSPVNRCINTAEYIVRGGKWNTTIKKSEVLFGPPCTGIQTTDRSLRLSGRENLRPVGVTAPPQTLMEFLCKSMLTRLSDNPWALGIAVSHDLVIGRFLKEVFSMKQFEPGEEMPVFLEGVLLQRLSHDRIRAVWRGDVVEFRLK